MRAQTSFRSPLTRALAWLLACAVVFVSLPAVAVAAPADDTPPEVAELNARAVEKFQAKEYDAAIELFLKAYDMRPEPNYLFNVGRVYEQKGDMKNAVDYYTRFLREPEVDIKAREVALERRRVLTAVLDETEPGWRDAPQAEPEPQAEPGPTEDTADDTTPDATDDTTAQPPPKKPRNKLRIAGYVLLGVGGAALVTGAAFAGVASGNAKELDTLDTLGARDDAIGRGKRNALIADVMFLSGGVIALTGLTLVLVSLKKKPSTTARARIFPTVGPSGAGVGAVMRF